MLSLIFSSDKDLMLDNLYSESKEERNERQRIEGKYTDSQNGQEKA